MRVKNIKWDDGTYTGEVNEDNEPHGLGTFYWPDETIEYEGEWKDGWKHGQGTAYWPDGTIRYKGEWENGERKKGGWSRS